MYNSLINSIIRRLAIDAIYWYPSTSESHLENIVTLVKDDLSDIQTLRRILGDESKEALIVIEAQLNMMVNKRPSDVFEICSEALQQYGLPSSQTVV